MGFSKLVENPTAMLLVNSTLTSFAISSPTISTAAIPAGVGSANIGGALSATLTFFGEGADNSTFDYRIYVRTAIYDNAGTATGLYSLRCLGYGTATLSTLTATIGGVSCRLADTLTFTAAGAATTVKGSLSAFAAARGEDTGTVYSPADNTAAELLLSAICKAGDILVDFDLTGATGANAIVELSRV